MLGSAELKLWEHIDSTIGAHVGEHDSMTPKGLDGMSCEFPDAYVDPYPELYAQLGAMADAVGTITESLPSTASTLKTTTQAWVANFEAVTANLQQMAENRYLKLFLYEHSGVESDPIVAEVHTQPTDESVADVGRILHVVGRVSKQFVPWPFCQWWQQRFRAPWLWFATT